MLSLEADRAQDEELERVWCAHCSWNAVATFVRSRRDVTWAMRVMEQHIQENHPERLPPQLAATGS